MSQEYFSDSEVVKRITKAVKSLLKEAGLNFKQNSEITLDDGFLHNVPEDCEVLDSSSKYNIKVSDQGFTAFILARCANPSVILVGLKTL